MIDFQYATLSPKTQGSGAHASNDDEISSHLACCFFDASYNAA